MGLIERIKSALGLGNSASPSQPGGTDAERRSGGATDEDGSDPQAAGEFARDEEGESAGTVVSKSGTTGESNTGDGADDGVDVTVEHAPSTESEDAVKGTDTAGSTETASTDSASTAESSAAESSTAEAPVETGSADTGSGGGSVSETDSADESGTTSEPSADLEDVKGIGPAYAERLRNAGVEDVATLAEADPADLSERADIPEARVRDMVERAGTY